MFCSNCGQQLPDGAKFCNSCGTPMNRPAPQAAAPQQPRPVAPQPAPRPVQAAPQARPVAAAHTTATKKEFLASEAGSGARKKGGLIFITMLLSIALIVGGVFLVQNTSVFEIPLVSLALNMTEDGNADTILEELDTMVEDARDNYKDGKDEMTQEQQELLELLLDELEELARTPSINNCLKLIDLYDIYIDDLEDAFGMDMDVPELEEAASILNIASIALWGLFALPLLFTLLAGLLKSTGLTVTALIFTLPGQLLLCGPIVAAAGFVVYIVQAILCGSINKAYRAYRLGRAA